MVIPFPACSQGTLNQLYYSKKVLERCATPSANSLSFFLEKNQTKKLSPHTSLQSRENEHNNPNPFSTTSPSSISLLPLLLRLHLKEQHTNLMLHPSEVTFNKLSDGACRGIHSTEINEQLSGCKILFHCLFNIFTHWQVFPMEWEILEGEDMHMSPVYNENSSLEQTLTIIMVIFR